MNSRFTNISKRILLLILSLIMAVMVVSVAGCSGEEANDNKENVTANADTSVNSGDDENDSGKNNPSAKPGESGASEVTQKPDGNTDKATAQPGVTVEPDSGSKVTAGPKATAKPTSKPKTTAKPTATPKVTPRPTEIPGSDYKLNVSGPDKLKKGDKVEYTIKLTECNYSRGFIGLDFCVDYNKDLLKYDSTATVKVPAKTWEVITRKDSDEKLTYFCIEDNDIIEDCKAIKGPEQFEVKLTFTVVGETSADKCIIKLYDVVGTKDNDALDMAYGSGNSINLK